MATLKSSFFYCHNDIREESASNLKYWKPECTRHAHAQLCTVFNLLRHSSPTCYYYDFKVSKLNRSILNIMLKILTSCSCTLYSMGYRIGHACTYNQCNSIPAKIAAVNSSNNFILKCSPAWRIISSSLIQITHPVLVPFLTTIRGYNEQKDPLLILTASNYSILLLCLLNSLHLLK